MTFVGRAAELATIERAIAELDGGTGQLVAITGPAGIGKSALLDSAVEIALERGHAVVRHSAPPGQPELLVWAQLLRDTGASDQQVARMLDSPGALDLDRVAAALSSDGTGVLAIDDLEPSLEGSVLLSLLASRLRTSKRVVFVASRTPIDVGLSLRLSPLSRDAVDLLASSLTPDARRAVWLGSRGDPALAASLVGELRSAPEGDDPIVRVALSRRGDRGFLEVDRAYLQLLESAAGRATCDGDRARLLARWAAALLGDARAADRRRELSDLAVALARATGDPELLAEVLDDRLHALWDAGGAEDRLAAGVEIVQLAFAGGDGARERQGLFWQFVAQVELADVSSAERTLADYERDAKQAGDGEGATVGLARRAMFDLLRGRFDDAEGLIEDVVRSATLHGLADAQNIGGALRFALAVERDLETVAHLADEVLPAMQRQHPGQLYEAVTTRALALLGRRAEAAVELERMVPVVLAGSGPRWLGSVADLAFAAAELGSTDASSHLAAVMQPYDGRLVVFSGASTCWGPVSHYLGLLSMTSGHLDAAVAHLQNSAALAERIGAMPYLAHSSVALASALAARGRPGDAEAAVLVGERGRLLAERLGMTVLLDRLDAFDVPVDGVEWALRRDGADWVLEAGPESMRLRDAVGLQHLRALLAAPMREIPALQLAAGGGGIVSGASEPLLDPEAVRALRRRVTELDVALERADAAGRADRSESLHAERAALLDELARSTGLGGRPRRHAAEAERARVNVTRALRATIDRIAAQAPRAAAHLHASIRTGSLCRYQPEAGGPARWRV